MNEIQNDLERWEQRKAELDEAKWWETHDNIVTLTSWMADNYYEAKVVAHAVEKPWNYTEEYLQALDALES